MHAVDSVQASARAWDVRAQIAGIGYIFLIGTIDSIEADLVSRSLPSHLLDFPLLLFFIMAGRAFGTILTMILVPVLYGTPCCTVSTRSHRP